VHEVIQADETGHASGVTHAAAEFGQAPEVTSAAKVGGDPTMVVELVTYQLMECRLGGTLVKHPSTIFRRS
jgi:hypothetical protein